MLFADVIWLRMLSWRGYPGLRRQALTASIAHVFLEERGRGKSAHRREGNHVATEAETGMMQSQVKECGRPPVAGRRKNRSSPPASGERMAQSPHRIWLSETDFGLLAPGTMRKYPFCCFQPPRLW